jgi:hypothetical protein
MGSLVQAPPQTEITPAPRPVFVVPTASGGTTLGAPAPEFIWCPSSSGTRVHLVPEFNSRVFEDIRGYPRVWVPTPASRIVFMSDVPTFVFNPNPPLIISGQFRCILYALTLAQLLSVLQVSTIGAHQLLVPPEHVVPMALLRLPDVTPTSGIGL